MLFALCGCVYLHAFCLVFNLVFFVSLGYGDISCQTILGKITLILFIFGGMVGSIFSFISFFYDLPLTNMSINKHPPVPGLIRTVYCNIYYFSWKIQETYQHLANQLLFPIGMRFTFSWLLCQQV